MFVTVRKAYTKFTTTSITHPYTKFLILSCSDSSVTVIKLVANNKISRDGHVVILHPTKHHLNKHGTFFEVCNHREFQEPMSFPSQKVSRPPC